MGLINYHKNCRVCGSTALETIFDLGEHYLHGLFVFPDFKPPERTVPTELVRCSNEMGGCGQVQLKHSIDPDILYSRYGYRSSTNATMREHLLKIVEESTLLWTPINEAPRCLDIGCNDGFLLRQFPAKYEKVGIDPCDIGNKIEGIENFTFINEPFPSDKLTHSKRFDIVTMIACFYDVNHPIKVAQEINTVLDRNGIAIIEVSYWPMKMDQNAIDEVCHEHVCFYNFQNLETIFKQAGLKIFNAVLNNINGGSIQIWLQKNESSAIYTSPAFNKNILDIKFKEMDARLDTPYPYQAFFDSCYTLKVEILELFEQIKKENKVVHLYGASTKGNVLLQFLELNSEQIPFAAERSPEKYHGSTLGTNIKMISEEESRAMKPDYYFVPIWSFKDEIIKREKAFIDGGGKLIFPLPVLQIVGN